MRTTFDTNSMIKRLLNSLWLGHVFLFCTVLAHADSIYVGNVDNQIERIDASGNVSVFGTSSVSDPAGLAFDGNGNLYVAAWLRVEKYDASGNRSVFASGLANAFGIAVSSAGDIYVADGTRLLKYNSSGQSAFFAPLPGAAPPDQNRAVLAFDSSGNLFAAYNGTIEKFDSSGNASFFASGPALPAGLAFDGSGNLYVSDSLSKIMEYNSSGNQIRSRTNLQNT